MKQTDQHRLLHETAKQEPEFVKAEAKRRAMKGN
jgi:hypothetical protein